MQLEAMGIPAHAAEPAAQPATTARNGGIDALRAVMTLLVLFHHTAITYGASGGWFYREMRPDGSRVSDLLILFVSTNQAYFMGLFFLLAGYFTPAVIRTKGALLYTRDRLVRLGVPLLVFGLILGPITVAMGQTARDRSFVPTLLAIWRQGRFIEGPLWFAEALLIFAAGALVWYALVDRSAGSRAPSAARPFPTHATLALAALVTGVAAFVIRLWWPVGTDWHGLQFGYFAGYVVLFVAGCAGADAKWLERVPAATAWRWFIVTLVALPIMPAAWLFASRVSILHGSSDGGWTIPAALYAFWEPFVAWGMILMLLIVFQRRFVRLSPLWQKLSARAYTIYIIHPPVLVALALGWRDVAAPALVKFAVTGTATCLVCYLVAGLLLRIPGVRRVL